MSSNLTGVWGENGEEGTKSEHTSTIPINPVHNLILAHLEQSPIARLANTVVPTMPRPADLIADFPLLLVGTHSNNAADDFVTGDNGEVGHGTKCALLEEAVGMADTACRHFDQDLALLRLLDVDLFDRIGSAGLLDDHGAALFGDLRRHIVSIFCLP